MATTLFRRQSLCAFIALLTIVCASGAAADYVALDLYPLQPPTGFTGVFAQGSAGGEVAGNAFISVPPALSAAPSPGGKHAVVWTAGGTPVDLHPADLVSSQASATDGSFQVGFGGGFQFGIHAFLWHGSAPSAVDLNPSFLDGTQAFGVGGGQQVGVGSAPGITSPAHAILWFGTAASAVDLNPDGLGITSSQANGTNGMQQVGHGTGPGTLDAQGHAHFHALLWNGTADSAVDLNPTTLPGITDSSANATNGAQQVGQGNPSFSGVRSGYPHALLWSGTAASAVDLHPDGFQQSQALGLNRTQQVGYALAPAGDHAIVWTGTAASAVDLQTFLPTRFLESGAYTIDAAGDVSGVAFTSSGEYAVEWLPHPVLPGDADLNGTVDFSDLLALAQHYGQVGGWVNGDFNDDGTVNFADLLLLAQNYGLSLDSSAVASVPEPFSISLLVGMAALNRKRR